jgi:endoplasmic reticulum junction formation protein lunapark
VKQQNDEDYETVLSSLALDIQTRQVKLSEIRLRERRSTLLVTLYTMAGWVAYVSLWYMSMLPNFSGQATNSKLERAVKGCPVVIGPIL